MLARLLSTAILLVALTPLEAQQNVPFPGAIEIEQALGRLNELGTVLMIAAHPDDEQTAVLAYFARGRHMRTAYLSVTRGEGGQNLIGSEQGAQMGVIRTQELLAARKIDGAEQFFTRAIDFGFSKTASETMEKWGHDRILGDIVWDIRRYRPDVIILVFSGTPSDGHGHHQVSAILGKEAFFASGDATRFPEQLQYVQPWQAKRLVRSSFGQGRGGPPASTAAGQGAPGTTPPANGAAQPPAQANAQGNGGRGGRGGRGGNAPGGRGGNAGDGAPQTAPQLPNAGEADTGSFNPILGYSYQELANMSRSMHHSQGTGAMRQVNPGVTYFGLVAGEASTRDIFEGIDTSWNRLPGGAAVQTLLEAARHDYEPAHPEKILPSLTKARPLIAAIKDPLAQEKLQELDETIALCAGLFVEAQASQAQVTPGGPLSVTTTVLNRLNADVSVESGEVRGIFNVPMDVKPAKLAHNQSARISFDRTVPPNEPYSQPYWLVKPPAGDVYQVDDQRLVGLPDSPPALEVRLRLTVDGTPIEVVRKVHHRYAERSEGERVRPMVVVPAVAVNLPDSVAMFPAAASRKVQVSLEANAANAAGELRLDLPAGWKATPASQSFKFATTGEAQQVTFEVTPPAGETTAVMKAIATVNGRDIESGMQVINYPHIPPQTLFPVSDVKLVRANIQVSVHKIGYIMGAGDEMPDSLRQLGLEVTLLGPSDLEQGDLARFDAIVAGVRAYNVRADLKANQARLMNYVKNGGTYVVQYQTGDASLNMGPYPFTVPGGSRYRVTVEQAPVTFPHVDSPLLQFPNHITPKDFDGWIQERGLYFATQWDKQYETVLSSHDPGEEPMEGGELWTRYGKGVFIFSAYDWFRELPAGVPGAFRLFANMISAK